jgi:esterase/lipase superfamily enzyme
MTKKLKFDAAKPLYTSDNKKWAIDELPTVLDSLYDKKKPVVVFVHGRGDEPKKSLQGGAFVTGLAVHKIELGYDVSVLMFNWDSDFPGMEFWDRDQPLRNTEPAAERFAGLLSQLKAYQAEKLDRPRPVLLTHSMGSIVLQKTIEANNWLTESCFKYVLLSQPDADDVGHEDWVEKLASVEKLFITMNANDWVLLKSTQSRPAGRKALGLVPGSFSNKATYIDLSNAGLRGKKDEDHEVFGKNAMNGQVHVCEFFTQVITGKPVLMDKSNVESGDTFGLVVLKNLQSNASKTPSLKVPKLPGLNTNEYQEGGG